MKKTNKLKLCTKTWKNQISETNTNIYKTFYKIERKKLYLYLYRFRPFCDGEFFNYDVLDNSLKSFVKSENYLKILLFGFG